MKVITLLYLIILITGLACTNKTKRMKAPPTEVARNKPETNGLNARILPGLTNYYNSIETEFTQISDERKKHLEKLALFIKTNNESGKPSNLIFICTHNSRRSHMSQLWAQTAAYHYGIKDVHCYSGGTESTAFNPRSVRALRKAGFNIEQTDSSSNPLYLVKYADDAKPVKGFSKKYDDEFNPQENFAAVMTCSHADETCPLVFGAVDRISIPYQDPKVADNTPEEEARYDERCRQIAREMFYVFYNLKGQ
jgi:arsenate reductase (thioredoxin)